MHPRVYREFERVLRERGAGGVVLDVGAIADRDGLLRLPALAGAKERIGINLDGPHEWEGGQIVRGNANHMDCFEDDRFDTVLCNAMLEHDPSFWLTLAEIRRVARPGALVVLGVPGYREVALEKGFNLLRRLPLVRGLPRTTFFNGFFTSTLTFKVHDMPGDYYRFGMQACREVLFAGMKDVEVRSVMLPPRFIGAGVMVK